VREVDLYDKPDERARVLQRQLDVYNEAEGNLEKHVKEGLVTQADLERLRYDKASLEIDLLTNKSDLSQPRPTPQPSPLDSSLRCFSQDRSLLRNLLEISQPKITRHRI
jgi:hypothetical protein